MIWDVEYSRHIAFFESLQVYEKTTPLDLRPDLDEIGFWFKEVFLTLSKGPGSEFGSSFIELQEMIFYFEYFGSPFPYDVSCFILRRIDTEILDYREKKRKQSSDSKKVK